MKRGFGSSVIPIIIVFAVFVFASGCGGIEQAGKSGAVFDRSKVTFIFFINETGEPVDGEVFLNGQELGNTSNGAIVLSKKALEPGTVVLLGVDKATESHFEFRFEFSGSDTIFDRLSLEVPLREYKRAIFDASKLDTEKIEQEVFAKANEERAKDGIKALRWSEKIAEVARAYSKVLPVEGFHHTDSEGKDVKRRLSDSGVTFVAANENLFFSGSVTEETNVAKSAIDGWLGSPGHRATLLDRDGIYSDAGVGAHCEKKECYVVMNFAALRQEQKLSLKKAWVTFHYLHNPGYNFASETVTVDFELSATSPVNVYVVPSYEAYKEFVDSAGRGRQSYIAEFKELTSINERFRAARGTGVIIESQKGDSEVQFSLEFS